MSPAYTVNNWTAQRPQGFAACWCVRVVILSFTLPRLAQVLRLLLSLEAGTLGDESLSIFHLLVWDHRILSLLCISQRQTRARAIYWLDGFALGSESPIQNGTCCEVYLKLSQ